MRGFTHHISTGGLSFVTLIGFLRANPQDTAITTHPTVFIDAEFEPDERLGIFEAIARWEDAVSEIKMHTEMIPHDAMVARMRRIRGVDNQIYLFRSRDSSDDGCPDSISGTLAKTFFFPGMAGSYICMSAGFMNSVKFRIPDLWRRVAEHEIGHAFFLFHESKEPSLMAPFVDDASPELTCVDVKQFCHVWKCVSTCKIYQR